MRESGGSNFFRSRRSWTGERLTEPDRPSDTQGPAVSCGIDLIEIDRIADLILRYGERFVHRVWTPGEQDICRGRYAELAARFAGKEAAMKALGTGVRGLGWQEIEILRDPLGKPLLLLHGGAADRARALGLTRWSISLTHSRLLASAVVVAQ
jgi:holo-[acyl-carrier protein] synthase